MHGCGMFVRLLVFFFKQKTAYEVRSSDWSSDVCSSDLVVTAAPKPLVAALDGQRLAITGALGQGAVAKRIEDTANKQYTGNSFACAGTVSNASGSPVTVGDNSCNFSDDPVSINFDNLLLDSGLEVIAVEGNVIGEALAPILGPLNDALAPLLEQITAALVPALEQALAPLADLVRAVTRGAIESRCVTNTGEQAIGESSIANASINLTLAGNDLGVITLDTNVPPTPTGTPLLSSTALLDHILPSITDSLTDTVLDGALRPVLEPLLLDGLLGQLITAIREPLLVPILDALLTAALTDAGILSNIATKPVPSANGTPTTATTLPLAAPQAEQPHAHHPRPAPARRPARPAEHRDPRAAPGPDPRRPAHRRPYRRRHPLDRRQQARPERQRRGNHRHHPRHRGPQGRRAAGHRPRARQGCLWPERYRPDR